MTPYFKIEGVRYELVAISTSDMDELIGKPNSRMAKIMGYPSFYDDSKPPRVWPLPAPGIRIEGLGDGCGMMAELVKTDTVKGLDGRTLYRIPALVAIEALMSVDLDPRFWPSPADLERMAEELMTDPQRAEELRDAAAFWWGRTE